MTKHTYHVPNQQPATLLVGIETPLTVRENRESYFEEFLNLCQTNGLPTDNTYFARLRTIDPGFFFTSGKLNELKKICSEQKIELVVLSESVSAQQERNLSDFLNCDVCDRTRLILEIFFKAAHSAEGKTQVEIAILQYKKSRLAGKGKHLMQQFGVSGVRGGPGETLKEKERRYLETRIQQLKKEFDRIGQHRATQRKKRLNVQIPHICIIGYTNAGKSTLFNLLTHSTVLAEDKLFATLDTTTRELYIDHHKKGIISDTVGFIQNLPTMLIEAFKSTLSELSYADLLLLVVDVSDPNWEKQIEVVHKVLRELHVAKDILYVFNKLDKVDQDFAHISDRIDRYLPHVVISARSKKEIEPLVAFLRHWNS